MFSVLLCQSFYREIQRLLWEGLAVLNSARPVGRCTQFQIIMVNQGLQAHGERVAFANINSEATTITN